MQEALGNEVVDDRPDRPTDEQLNAMAAAAREAITAGGRRKPRRLKVAPQPAPTADVSLRMWQITFRDLDGWLDKYDAGDVATAVTAAEWARFKRVAEQVRRFEQTGDAARAAMAEKAG